jgi:hypothetical protein
VAIIPEPPAILVGYKDMPQLVNDRPDEEEALVTVSSAAASPLHVGVDCKVDDDHYGPND